ncbi:retrotransposon protein, putative, ty1-copia subclass, partial [Tanacetum coccineum]
IVLSIKDKLNYLEQLIPSAPVALEGQQVALEIIEEGQSVSFYVLKMKGYIDNLEHLGHPVSLNLGVSLILISLRKEFDSFVQNYNMHSMGKTINELHAMLKLHEQTLPKNNSPALYAIRAGKGLRASRKLKPGALSLCMGNGQRAEVKANGSYHLSLPSGLVIVLNNSQYAPSITRGIISVSRLYDDGYVNHFVDNSIQVSRNNMVYFSVVPRDEFLDHLKDHGIIAHRTPPYMPQHNGVSERRNRTLLDMVRSMMSQTTLLKSFWDYALETATRILNMVPTKKVEKTPYEPGKLELRSIKCIFIGYPKETMGYSFYYPPENKVLVAWNAKFLENSLITQEASGSLEDLEIIHEEDTHPSIYTSLHHEEDDLEIDEAQSDIIPIRDLGKPANYKAALLDCYTQTPGIDYEETFSPVADIRAIRILIAIAAYYDYKIWQIDVKTAFLNGYLSEEVYMEQPEGFINPKYPKCVCKLKRSIYGLKQAPRQWNKRFDDEIKKFSFTQNRDEPCVYLKASGSNVTFLILYVDDILIMGNNIPMLQDVKSYLGRCFAMKDLGEAAYILGIKIYKDRSRRLIEKLRLSKSQRASTPAELKHMQNVPYASVVGSIMNTKDIFLVYGGDIKRELRVSCYTDVGYLTDADDLKSHTGYVFVLNGGVVDWKSAKKSIFATSYAEAEYIVPYDASKEGVWVRKFIFGLGVVPTIEEPINMYWDNTGAITISNESGITKGAGHVRAKVHYLCEVIEFGDIKLEKFHTYDNLADPFTKELAFPKHSEHTKNIGMVPTSSLM